MLYLTNPVEKEVKRGVFEYVHGNTNKIQLESIFY